MYVCILHKFPLFVCSKVITKVSISLAVKPRSTTVLLAKVDSFSKVLSLLLLAKAQLGGNLSAFEFMDYNSISVMKRVSPHILHRYAMRDLSGKEIKDIIKMASEFRKKCN